MVTPVTLATGYHRILAVAHEESGLTRDAVEEALELFAEDVIEEEGVADELDSLRRACIALLANLDSDGQFDAPNPNLVDDVREALGDTPEAGPGCVHCGWPGCVHPFSDHGFEAPAAERAQQELHERDHGPGRI